MLKALYTYNCYELNISCTYFTKLENVVNNYTFPYIFPHIMAFCSHYFVTEIA